MKNIIRAFNAQVITGHIIKQSRVMPAREHEVASATYKVGNDSDFVKLYIVTKKCTKINIFIA